MLPRGIVLLRIQVDGRRYTETSERLTDDQARAARLLACAMGHDRPLIIITCAELLAAMSEAAA